MGNTNSASSLPLWLVWMAALCSATLVLPSMAEVDCVPCNSTQHRSILLELFNATNGEQRWKNKTKWNTTSSVCDWFGVVCSDTCITEIHLPRNNLFGILPPVLSELLNLTVLDVSENALCGSLPPEYSSWSSLSSFIVSYNNLGGTLPPNYSNWGSIERFNISHNNILGVLPEQYSAWGSVISEVDISVNRISGTLSDSLSTWISLSVFEASINQLNGSLPDVYALAWNRSLITFSAAFNYLSGSIPSEYFSEWKKLQVFQVAVNRLSGTLPPVATLLELRVLMLCENDFEGSIPSIWVLGNKLEALLLHNNSRLNGTIPVSFPGNSLFAVSVCNTSLCGRMPTVWQQRKQFLPLLPMFVCQPFSSKFLTMFRNPALASDLFVLAPSQHMPACPSAQPTEPSSRSFRADIALRESSLMSNVNEVGVVISGLAAGGGVLPLRRTVLVAHLAAVCVMRSSGATDAHRMAHDVDVFNSPLQLRIGPSDPGEMHRGAVVGNLVLWVGLAALLFASLSVMRNMKKPKESSALVDCAARLHAPGILIVPVALLLQQIVVSSVLLLDEGRSSAANTGVGVTGLLVCSAICVSLWVLLDPRPSEFCALSCAWSCKQDAVIARGPPRVTAGFSRLIRFLTEERTIWLPRRRSRSLAVGVFKGRLVECCGLLFRGAAVGRQWWLAADVSVTVLVSCIAAVRPRSAGMCAAQMWIVAAISGVWAVAAMVARPKHRRLACASTIFANVMQFVVAVLQASEIPQGVVSSATLCAVVISTTCSAVVFGARVLLAAPSAPDDRSRHTRLDSPVVTPVLKWSRNTSMASHSSGTDFKLSFSAASNVSGGSINASFLSLPNAGATSRSKDSVDASMTYAAPQHNQEGDNPLQWIIASICKRTAGLDGIP